MKRECAHEPVKSSGALRLEKRKCAGARKACTACRENCGLRRCENLQKHRQKRKMSLRAVRNGKKTPPAEKIAVCGGAKTCGSTARNEKCRSGRCGTEGKHRLQRKLRFAAVQKLAEAPPETKNDNPGGARYINKAAHQYRWTASYLKTKMALVNKYYSLTR
ncbi:hypothetical protein SAMN02910342_01288 [Butyrivibrio sp. INlla21]|nr:hypothetical protein SAMN02910342_01288 [Butyrivibrio sp. INlla21]